MTLSDPTAQFEATVYQERLADWREMLEPGQSLFVQIGGEFDPDTEEMRARIQALEPLEAMAARKAQAIRVFLDAPEPIERLASRLDAGEGTVSVVVMLKEPRGGGQTPRPVPRDPAGRRRHQGGAGHAARRGAIASPRRSP